MEKLLVLMGIHFLALAIPGSDFIFILRSSLSGEIKKTLLCCVGISLGVITHLLMLYFGLSFILSQSEFLYSIIVISGCLWLIKMGISGLRSKKSHLGSQSVTQYDNGLVALRNGYFSNLLNPKALIYFVSIISPLIKPGEESGLFFVVSLMFTIMTFFWFSFLAISLNTQSIRNFFEQKSMYMDRFFSVIILMLAFYILYTEIIELLY